MSGFFRPEMLAALFRAREVIFALGLAAVGGWLLLLGGWVLIPLGLAVSGIAAVLGVTGWRRMRFSQTVLTPGVVEVDEGQIGYLGPEIGGYVSLPELVEIRLLSLRGRRVWRLKQADGQAVLVPVDAVGAERLFDAFASLPGMDTAGLVAALDPQTGQQAAPGGGLPAVAGPEMRVIWRRAGRSVIAGS